MSLQLWLTLNGNIKNKGLSKSTITIPNTEKTTYDSDNWCYNFANANSNTDIGGGFIVKDPPKFSTSINHTIAFWYKGNKTGIIYTAPKRTTNGDTVDKMTYSFQNSKLTTSVGAFNNTSAIPENVFTHIVVVFNYTEKKANLYINGVFIETKTFTTNILPENIADDYACIGNANNNYGSGLSLNELSKGSTYILNGSIKDFRLYDHCLSTKEIKEVYKSLILHYPFNNNGLEYNNPNLAINTNFKNNMNNWRNQTDNIRLSVLHDNSFFINQKFIRCNILNIPTSSSVSFGMYNNIPNLRNIVENGEKYTISAYIRSNRLMRLHFKNELMSTNSDVVTIDTQWKFIKVTSTIDTSNEYSANTFYLTTAGNSNIVAGDYFDVCMLKLEKGENATAWLPNEIDFNNTSIINDTSGFGTYGIINGDLSYDPDSKVYNSSIVSNGNNYIELSNPLPKFVSDTNSIKYSLSVWIYPTKDKDYITFIDRNTDLVFGVGGSSGEIIWSGISDRNYVCSRSFLNINNWNHIVIVKGVTDSLYINNTKMTSFLNNKERFLGGTPGSIMCRYNDGIYAYYYQGKISDLRIYATALTADDVNELYNNRVSVDKDGNIFMRNIIEV